MNKELLFRFKNFYSDFMNEDVIEFTKDRDEYTDDEIYDLFVSRCGIPESAPVNDVAETFAAFNKEAKSILTDLKMYNEGRESRQPEVDALKSENAALKKRVEELERKLKTLKKFLGVKNDAITKR